MAEGGPGAADLRGYDPVARLFHWLTALLVLSNAVLGYTMARMPAGTEAEAAQVLRSFSVHKAVGLAAFAVALGRIGWALGHPRPGPLHPERRLETFLAALVHWTLYGALLVMPVSGWLYHAASPQAFAPIPWPFGQGLPLVPKDEGLALVLGMVHHTAAWALFAALALHLAGAFRHAILDMDTTMARITTGLGAPVAPARAQALPALAALALWALVIATGYARAPLPEPDPFAGIGGEAAGEE